MPNKVKENAVNSNLKAWDFVGKFKFLIWIPVVIIFVGIVINIIFGTQLDINFKGGSMATYSFTGTIDHDEAAASIQDAIGMDVDISETQDYSDQSTSLVVTIVGDQSIDSDTMTEITSALQESFPDNHVEFLESTSVDPTVGASFFQKSLYTMFLAALFVVIYVGLRFRKIGGISAALMALVALVHDMIISYFVYVILQIPLDDNFIAVILTILGYSLNATIVIYDRIRENRGIYGSGMSHREIVNLSITQSFRRSVMTSSFTFCAIVTVAIVAGICGLTSIMSFAIPMSVGVVSGTFSSVCIAGPLWVYWLEFRDRHKGKKSNGNKAKAGTGTKAVKAKA